MFITKARSAAAVAALVVGGGTYLAMDSTYTPPAPVADPDFKYPLVYTRQPRHQTPIPADPGQSPDYAIDDASNEQLVNDIAQVMDQTEYDVVYLDDTGMTHVLYDCTGHERICSAQEARVSPDGTRVIFSVSRAAPGADQWFVKAMNGPWTDVWYFKTDTAELWMCILATKECRALTTGNVDRFPEWASNDVIVYTSDQAGTYAPRSVREQNFYVWKSFQLHRSRLEGWQISDTINLTPDKWFVMSPEVTSWGDVCYAHYEGVAPRDFGSTPQNHWWQECKSINGLGIHSEFGAHGTGGIKSREYITDILVSEGQGMGEGQTEARGIRGIQEIWPNYLMVSNYYRANSRGANGSIFGWESDGRFSEGCLTAAAQPGIVKYSDQFMSGSGRYTPCSVLHITPWGQDQDMNSPKIDKTGRALGRAGYPFALPGNVSGYTRSRGWCYRAVPPGWATYAAMGGEPPCKGQIEMSKVGKGGQILNPFDGAQSECIAGCSLDYHAWDAQYAGPYRDLFGIEEPAIAEITPLADECSLNVVNAKRGELWPIQHMNDLKGRTAFQGNIIGTPEEALGSITSFGVDMIEHWPMPATGDGVYKVSQTLGQTLEEDGSVKLVVPCRTPFQHFASDANGERVANGIAPLAAFGDEFCFGCHDGHSTERATELGATAEALFLNTIAGGGAPVPPDPNEPPETGSSCNWFAGLMVYYNGEKNAGMDLLNAQQEVTLGVCEEKLTIGGPPCSGDEYARVVEGWRGGLKYIWDVVPPREAGPRLDDQNGSLKPLMADYCEVGEFGSIEWGNVR